jgi:glyoxylase-like metal-dependent hydrolase (beta-lactamase superfamily II)
MRIARLARADRSIPQIALLAATSLLVATTSHAGDGEPPRPVNLAPKVWWIPGAFPEDRQPDGNTVVFEGETGLIVMDTGRHTWHRQAILDFARASKRPVSAIINSHWHLDHTSGNADIKRTYPRALLYTGVAVEKMIREVWPASIARSQAYLDSGQAPAALAQDIKGDIETRRHPEALVPDVAVTESGSRTIDGLKLELHLARNAATDSDVWVYERASRIAAAGDLVTLPVPFLDTACVKGWRAALDDVMATPFLKVLPGHGPAMDRDQFVAYKFAFEAYTDCANSAADKAMCAASWLKSTAGLRAPEPADDARASEMAEEYVDLLRANGGNGLRCTG